MVEFNKKEPPREFRVGRRGVISMSDCGTLVLEDDEQVTFVSSSGAEYDVASKSWGYYATPSVNGRLKAFGYKTAFVKNAKGALYVMIVEQAKMKEFLSYCEQESQTVVEWLSDR